MEERLPGGRFWEAKAGRAFVGRLERGSDLVEAVERAEEGYVAVMYDSHAWYRIMESLEKINLRLESAIGVMERVRDRATG